MSVKDLIWINVGQAIRIERNGKREIDKFNAQMELLGNAYLAICDCREISYNTNLYCRIEALKGTKAKKIKPMDADKLPSSLNEQEKEKERRSKMTPEEIEEEDLKNFMAGKKIRR